ncbi:MAG: hypothetical protein U0Q11_24930 [Vicinamibacterales bacterium]|mgnify:CR=1 FL=1
MTRRLLLVSLAIAITSWWGCEQLLLQPTASSQLAAVAVACEPRSGTPSTHAYCPAWACFADRSTQFVTTTAVWSSSNEAVATVDNGVVAFHTTGDVVISATYHWQNGAAVTGAHHLTITETGCTVSNPSRSLLCDGAAGGTSSVFAPGTCPALLASGNN